LDYLFLLCLQVSFKPIGRLFNAGIKLRISLIEYLGYRDRAVLVSDQQYKAGYTGRRRIKKVYYRKSRFY
jgi:hypothetical protein